jgi:hypothetical protein
VCVVWDDVWETTKDQGVSLLGKVPSCRVPALCVLLFSLSTDLPPALFLPFTLTHPLLLFNSIGTQLLSFLSRVSISHPNQCPQT